MARSPIRARLAPVALLLVLVFVVLGYVRVDRDRPRIEADYAASVASRSAALVESFFLRGFAQLHAVRDAILDGRSADSSVTGAVSQLLDPGSELTRSFDALWLVEASGAIRTLRAAHATARSFGSPDSTRLAQTPGALQFDESRRENSARITTGLLAERKELFLSVPVRTKTGVALVGAVALDSLGAILRRQPDIRGLSLVLRTSSDSLVVLPAHRAEKRIRTIEREIETPVGVKWSVAVTYSPSSGITRVALPVVGMLAIISLGVGLLLERREAKRIADRSSELEHLSAELLRANRAKSEFLANVSHELRTPLNAIVGFVDLLRDGVYGSLNPRQVGPVERIEASANHLRHLVDQVLDLAKMAAGRLEVHTEPLELRPFVFDVASEVEPLITEKGLSFSLAVGASLPRVRTDPTHLRQILINLLGNAVKFTNAGGISVRGKLVGGGDYSEGLSPSGHAGTLLARAPHPERPWIALQVADSGTGIPDKDRERVFDEFEQVDAGPRGDSMRRGTGLGLSISRRLARLLGGDITVESELGRGSVFTVWLPVDPADLRSGKAA